MICDDMRANIWVIKREISYAILRKGKVLTIKQKKSLMKFKTSIPQYHEYETF